MKEEAEHSGGFQQSPEKNAGRLEGSDRRSAIKSYARAR